MTRSASTPIPTLVLLVALLWALQGCAHVEAPPRPPEAPPTLEAHPVPAPGPASPAEQAASTPSPAAAEPSGPSVQARPPGEDPKAPSIPVPVPPTPPPEAKTSKASEAASRAPAEPAPTEAPPLLHTVRWKGETLSLIAEWYTAAWENWEAIAAANPGIDPERITLGNKIRIPAGLLKRRDPLPQDFVPTLHPGRPRKGPADRAAVPLAEAIPLFEPAEALGGMPRREPVRLEGELYGPAEIDEKALPAAGEADLFGPVP